MSSEKTNSLRNYQKSAAGLYPHEILMLSYAEKYCAGAEPAKFWKYDYKVDNVPTLLSSLEKRGFISNNKLTEAGMREIERNEYVLYMHRHKISDISMTDIAILVNKHPDRRFRDLLWGEFNRLSMDYMVNRQYGYYRNMRYTMFKFLMEENRYADALFTLSEVFLFDINGHPKVYKLPNYIKTFRELQCKLDYTEQQLADVLAPLTTEFTPYHNMSVDDVIRSITAYCYGNDEIANHLVTKAQKRAEKLRESEDYIRDGDKAVKIYKNIKKPLLKRWYVWLIIIVVIVAIALLAIPAD